MIDFVAYREKYREYLPDDHIKHLLIGESPPKQRGMNHSFFYYDKDDVRKVGGLFKNTMMALYKLDWNRLKWEGERIPESKRRLLKKFSSDGFYLIDETDQIIAGLDKREKRSILKRIKDTDYLEKQISDLAKQAYVTRKTKIAFISCLGYDIFFDYLKKKKISIGSGKIQLENILIDKRVPLPFHNRKNSDQFKKFIGSL